MKAFYTKKALYFNTHTMFYRLAVELSKARLVALKELLTTIETQSHEKNMSDEAVLWLKLAPDMFDFKRQVQIATDNAKGAAGRLSGKEIPSFEDNEQTFAELQARLDKTVAYLDTFTEADFENAASRTVELIYFKDMHFTADGYLIEYFIPNFHFHLVTAYAIARNAGFEIGKKNFMHQIPLIPNA